MVTKLILDVDPGIDAALALVTACCWDKAELLGVGAVAGARPLDEAVANAAGILKEMGCPAQVFPGASLPLHGKRQQASGLRGLGGLGHWRAAPDPDRVSPTHAALFIAQAARAHPGQVALVAAGPLTNVALALEYHPQDVAQLAALVLMGGVVNGGKTVTPAAEYNIFADAAAADIVLNSGLNTVVIGQDTAREVFLDAGDICRLAGGGKAARAVVALAGPWVRELSALPLHAPLALLAAVQPCLFAFGEAAVAVEARGDWTSGCILADWEGKHNWPNKVQIALQVDARRSKELLLDLWTRC
ncbi:MAG: nucleoside hydrolase [Firmicutes bacterium]|nr:nucleoside hydrolase [Bacillota bacterium]HOB34193.1 nucleoside hydrolase [Bacillota bacterium]HPZ90187.1 nucleoside hydrolase [Bacillota bacterium]HQE01577.1 nucleoside hydrolase [Bacillota bacterium]